MKTLVWILLSVLIGSVTPKATELFENWDRVTCKIFTRDSVGTGFVLRYSGKVFVVTNKHVIDPGMSRLLLKLRPSVLDQLALNDTSLVHKSRPPVDLYYISSASDLAFIRIPTSIVKVYDLAIIGESFIGSDSLAVPGAEVYFLGYPAGASGRIVTTPLVRQGIIAGVTDHHILIDGNVFGGSSGSPVFVHSNLIIGVVSRTGLSPIVGVDSAYENLGLGFAVKVGQLVKELDRLLEQLNPESAVSDSTGSGK